MTPNTCHYNRLTTLNFPLFNPVTGGGVRGVARTRQGFTCSKIKFKKQPPHNHVIQKKTVFHAERNNAGTSKPGGDYCCQLEKSPKGPLFGLVSIKPYRHAPMQPRDETILPALVYMNGLRKWFLAIGGR